jgi:hypothetical protein
MFPDNQAQAALHFKGDGNQTVQTYANTSYKAATMLATSIDQFHTYQLWWTPESIRVGVDGDVNSAHFEYMKPAGATASWWPFDNPMDIILNVAIGGTMGGTVPTTDFSYTMEVDYVRVYQEGSVFDAGDVLSAAENANNAALLQSVATASVARTAIDLDQVREAVATEGITNVAGVEALFTAASTGAMQRLEGAGIDLIDLDEALVDALAGADIDLDAAFSTGTLQVTAAAEAAGTTALLQSSLRDLADVGVDRVLLPASTDTAVLALRDKADMAATVDLTDLPFFVHNADQDVALVLDDDDVTALLANTSSLQLLAAQGITQLRPDGTVTAGHLTSLTQSAAATLMGVAPVTNLTTEEVELLGLGNPPSDPFGPFVPQPI